MTVQKGSFTTIVFFYNYCEEKKKKKSQTLHQSTAELLQPNFIVIFFLQMSSVLKDFCWRLDEVPMKILVNRVPLKK